MAGHKLILQQKQQQKLTPQQIQVIKLLEIPTAELEQRIKKEMEENPVLEIEGDTPDTPAEQQPAAESADNREGDSHDDDYYIGADDDVPEYRLMANNYSKNDKQPDIPFAGGKSFHEFMLEQLGLAHLSDDEQKWAEYIIGNIDDDGYLRRDIPSICDDLAFNQIQTTDEQLEGILRIIQNFDPPGVGARNIRECLLLQLKRKKDSDAIHLACNILENNFDEFTKKHYDKICRKNEVSEAELKAAIEEILKLNPKPGSAYSSPLNKANQTIIPDFILDNDDGEFNLSLTHSNVPELKMNSEYKEMLHNYARRKSVSSKEKEAIQFVRQKMESARSFVDAIQQRQQTLLLTMTEIIDFQREYFKDGDEAKLKPMILKDIADRTGLDVSTISRVSNSKYIQTHFGIFPLKYFFSEGMHKDTGEEVSTHEIKKILEDCIAKEDKRHPLTDDHLTNILHEKQFPIARRTVAKYREQLGIPVARLRREL
ncbi:MAG: RNA polymerase factor sigma-54 [Bacteroidales bacterium]|jgi:RNA polymerase sigma-54 factor|nr:RNA polymerase factor sigma-54 [Bacteroidales bacterium]